MHLWDGSYAEFLTQAKAGALAATLVGKFYGIYGYTASESEAKSWANSLAELAKAMKGAVPEDAWIVCEYQLPLTGERIDVIVLGRDRNGVATAVVIENKQWSEVEVEPGSTVIVAAGAEREHPSRQAANYVGWLRDSHSAFQEGELAASSCCFLHNLASNYTSLLRGGVFTDLAASSPVFGRDDADAFRAFLTPLGGGGGGKKVFDIFGAGRFRPSKKLIDVVAQVVKHDERFHLIGRQQVAYDAILSEAKKLKGKKGKSAILVRGGPGTGKSVIAVQLLADALQLGLKAVHSTGGKAFATTLRSKFAGAEKLFAWNMNVAQMSTSSIDLLLLDEAHRIRETSNTRFTPKHKRSDRTQIEDLLNAAKVTVFLLDENQFMRPDEVGTTDLIRHFTEQLDIPLREFDLELQFRCGGCREYAEWLDFLLGFSGTQPRPWGAEDYTFRILAGPQELDALIRRAKNASERARIVAGFCWRWSDPDENGVLVPDVKIGRWERPWNAKREERKRYTPTNDPYTIWADTPTGEEQIGCIYSAQGFEFDRVGVIWGPDLVWRDGEWVAESERSHDKPVKQKGADTLRLVRNAYRVLMSRGTKETAVLILDEETRAHVEEVLGVLTAASGMASR